MEIAVLVFDGLTALDAIGPLEVIDRLPDADVKVVAKSKGEIRCGGAQDGLGLMADYALTDVPSPEILVIPGGMGTRTLVHDEAVTGWIRRAHETSTWTTSVCTGSLLLGAAGLLKGLPATTHWRAMDLLAEFGAIVTGERVVESGKIITAAGVSSGIDMALTLVARVAGETYAKSVQLGIEYDPQPPFDCGSLDKAPPEVRKLAGAQ